MSTGAGRWWRVVALGSLVIWGAMHVLGGTVEISAAYGDGGRSALELLASSAEPSAIPATPGPVTESMIAFHGFLIAAAGMAVIVLTASCWYRRRPASLAGPLVIVAVADVGLLVFLVAPGHTPLTEAMWGPALLVAAAVSAAAARLVVPSREHQTVTT